MNIGLISREYPPFFGGGIGTYTDQTACALARAGHRVVVVTVSSDGREHAEDRDGVTVVRLPFVRGHDWSGPDPAIADAHARRLWRRVHPVAVFALQVARAAPRLIAEHGLEVFESPDTGALGAELIAAIARGECPPVPLVTTVHSPSAWIARVNGDAAAERTERGLWAAERRQARGCAAVTTPSRAMAAEAAALWDLPLASIRVIPAPLGRLEPVALASAESPAPRPNARAVLFAGRLEPRKGVATLLDALPSVLAAVPDAQLTLAGEDVPDPASPARRFGAPRIAALPEPLRARVRHLGRLSPDALTAQRALAPIAVVPSPTDNYPNTCIEAMAAGQIVVAARSGGMAEMIEHGVSGLLFTPEDPAALAEALERALTLPPAEAAAMQRAAARRILAVGGNAAVTAAKIDHYRQALSAPPPRPRGRLRALLGW